ncbi:aminotransferase class-III [Schizosaccharomyces osmophilus]|uniref:Aminotransferase class-III n=1 Tax=Schizosaccharomyces osmophilus TaxID=2545709 RepID=A0AAE9WA82_9SCHI|nr:aminotransferase class-III [Schizosaccharomyces osmophilus]WBW72465.1 aminotransferase class-III [Schizosaccharomyces osmophilus]
MSVHDLLYLVPNSTPPKVVRGEGVNLYTDDNKKIIDGTGGAAVSSLGYGNREVIESMKTQAEKVCYVHNMAFTNEPAEELAHILVSQHPDVFARAYFANSGSEAVEAALKFALQYWQLRGEPERTHFVSRKQSYHGNTLFALGIGKMVSRRAPYVGVFPKVTSYVDPCYAYRCKKEGETDEQYVYRLEKQLEDEFLVVGPNRIAAFIAETVPGTCLGCATPVDGYFKAVRRVCDKFDILLILDEVMCGLGRTGTFHAWEQEGITPDLQTNAKTLAAGYQPISSVLVSHRVYKAFEESNAQLANFHTYQAHPLACSAAVTVQKIMLREKLVDKVAAIGKYLDEQLHKTFDSHPHVGDIRGRGVFWGLEFVKDKKSKQWFDPKYKVGALISKVGIKNGAFLNPGAGTYDGVHGDHIMVAPPYIITKEEVDTLISILAKSIDEAIASLPN